MRVILCMPACSCIEILVLHHFYSTYSICLAHVGDCVLLRTQKELSQWHRPAIFYALRLMIAPAIENLLLLDRLLYLRELPGVRAELRPVFDPGLSPRTFTISAWKF